MEERRAPGAIELVEGEDKGFEVARVRVMVGRPEWMFLPAGHRNKRELHKPREEVGRERESMEEGYSYLQGGEEKELTKGSNDIGF